MKRILPILLLLALAPLAAADLQLDSIRFDPSIISSGDEVDIIVQFQDSTTSIDTVRSASNGYTLQVALQPDDDLTGEHVTITDAAGDDMRGSVIPGGVYAKRFRVKVAGDAPAGDYEFRLSARWYRDGQPEGSEQFLRFRMPVKREGIQLSFADVVSQPVKVRSGDDNVLLTATIINTGEKAAKTAAVRFSYPEGITASATNNNQRLLGAIQPQQSMPVQLYIDTDDTLPAGVYSLDYTIDYTDVDDNTYTKQGELPIVIQKRPYIVVSESVGSARAGDTAHVTVTVQNIGEEEADAVDLRILKQSSQPFEMDVRSDYIGPLAPGQSGTATFELDVHRDAAVREHALTVVIRASGDAEEGDNTVYTYTDSIGLDVTDGPSNPYPVVAAIAGVLLATGTAVYFVRK